MSDACAVLATCERGAVKIVLALAAPFPSPQGSQVYVRGMARALAAAGDDVTVVAYGYGEGEPGIRVVGVPVPPTYRRMRSGPDFVKPFLDLRLAAALRRIDADVVHAHNYEALAASFLCGKPVVYNNHSLLAEELPTYFASGRAFWGAAGALVDRTLPRRARAVVAITEAAARRLRSLGCARVTTIPPGVDPADFVGATPRRLGPRPTVVYAGNPDAYQNLPLLTAAMQILSEWRLLIVTATPFDMPGATVITTSSWSETRDWIAGADVAAIPRALAGGFPLKLLNSLALGVPTVVTAPLAQGLVGEIVVPPDDPRAFARGVEAAQKARAEHAHIARETLRNCSWGRRAAAIRAVYATVLD